MSLNRTNRGLGVALIVTLLTVGVTLVTHADPPTDKGSAAQPSKALTSPAFTGLNPGLNRLNPTPTAFKQVQDDLFRPLANSLKQADSMDGVTSLPLPPPPQRVIPTSRMREQMDLRKNWAFADLNDLYPQPTAEEAAGVQEFDLNNKDKHQTSLIEKYYSTLGQKTQATNSSPWQNLSDSYNAALLAATNGAVARPFAPETNALTKELFSTNAAWNGANKEFSLGMTNAFYTRGIHDEPLAAQRRIDDFRRALDHQPELATPGILKAVTGNPGIDVNMDAFGARAPTAPTSAFNALLNPKTPEAYRSPINPQLGFIDPTASALRRHGTDDPTAAALGLPNPPPPPLIPPAPHVDPSKVSQKMLDPFGAVVQKPRF